MADTKLHPLDFSALERGTVIPDSELEDATGCLRTDPLFSLKLKDLRDLIEVRTGILSCYSTKLGGLRLMTESEALPWALKRTSEHARGIKRNAQRIADIDSTRLLSDGERAAHDHAIRLTSMMSKSIEDDVRKARNLFDSVKMGSLSDDVEAET
jgi:hypothetical protein